MIIVSIMVVISIIIIVIIVSMNIVIIMSMIVIVIIILIIITMIINHFHDCGRCRRYRSVCLAFPARPEQKDKMAFTGALEKEDAACCNAGYQQQWRRDSMCEADVMQFLSFGQVLQVSPLPHTECTKALNNCKGGGQAAEKGSKKKWR
jgi:hypothetical protein